MRILNDIFEKNKAWARRVTAADPEFFLKLSLQQTPKYLWIGCSDSRVPANEIVDLAPGELFVHRNVANLVIHTDLNCLSVLQYAVDVLKVEHVIVAGHYGCGGVLAAIQKPELGLIDNWLRNVDDVQKKHMDQLNRFDTLDERHDRLCELNVIEQAVNVCETTIVQAAWKRGQKLAVHAWIYRLTDGILRDLSFCVSDYGEMNEIYGAALQKCESGVGVL